MKKLYVKAAAIVLLAVACTAVTATDPAEAIAAKNAAIAVERKLEEADAALLLDYKDFTNRYNKLNTEFTADRPKMTKMHADQCTAYQSSAQQWYNQSWADRGKSEQSYNNGRAWMTLAYEQESIGLWGPMKSSCEQAIICYNAGLQWNAIAFDDLDFGWMALDMLAGVLAMY